MIVKLNVDDKRIIEICSSYWAIGADGQFLYTVAEITKRHALNAASLRKIVSAHSAAFSEESPCIGCGRLYQFGSRADFTKASIGPNWVCVECRVREAVDRERKFRERLRQKHDLTAARSWSVEDLGFREKAYLLAASRHSASEDLSYIRPYTDNRITRLSPDPQFDLEILESLYRSGLISIHPESSLSAFQFDDRDDFQLYLDRVTWSFVLPQGATHPRQLIEATELLLFGSTNRDDQREAIREVIRELSVLECLCFLRHVLADHGLSFVPGEKTKLVLERVLESFSVAQAYNMIWRAGKDAAAFYMRSPVHRRHAANTVVGCIQRQLERAVANNWNVTAFHRNFNYPQSVLSQVVFNLCLKTDDGGFRQPLRELLIGKVCSESAKADLRYQHSAKVVDA